MKKIVYILIAWIFLTIFAHSTYAIVCNQTFEGTYLRYNKTYRFYDTMKNSTNKNVYVNTRKIRFMDNMSSSEVMTSSYLDPGSAFGWTQTLKNSGYKLTPGKNMRIIETGATKWRVDRKPSKRTTARKGNHDFMIYYKVGYDFSNNYPNASDDIQHVECQYFSVTWCGDGVRDAGYEVCDPKDPKKTGWGNGGCNNSCQPITVNPPATCNSLTASPLSGEAPFNTTLSCAGTNASTYQIQCGNGQVLNAKTGTCSYATGSNYNAQCIVNGNITSNACKKVIKVTNPQPGIRIDKLDANSDDLDGNTGNDTQTVVPGKQAVFKIRVTNSGDEALKNLKVNDTIAPLCAGSVTLPGTYPASWSNFKIGGSGDHTNNVLDKGEWYEYTCVKGNTQADYDNEATTAGTGIVSGETVTDHNDTEILLITPSIQVVKLDGNPSDLDKVQGNDTQNVVKGSPAIFSIVVTNDGTEDLKNISLTDPIAPSCASDGNVSLATKTFTNKEGVVITITPSGGTGDHNDSILQVGESFTYTCSKDNTQAAYTNIVDVNGVGMLSNLPVDDDDDTKVITSENVYDLALQKLLSNATPGPFKIGSTVTFTIRVKNQGTVDAVVKEIIDYIPTGLTLNDSAWTQNNGNAYYNPDITLAPDESKEIPITFTVNSNAPKSITNFAEISEDNGDDCDSTPDEDNTNDGTPVNDDIGTACETGGDEDDHDPETIVITDGADIYDLALVKTIANQGPYNIGEAVTFTITVTNQGTVDANNVEITDYIPTGLTLNDAAWAQSGANAVRTIASVPVGTPQDVTISFTVNAQATTTIVNYAEISNDDGNDCDSTADNTNLNTPGEIAHGDNVIGTACDTTGDEDDHDPASITTTVPPKPSIAIDKTDANTALDQDGSIGNDNQKVNKGQKAVFKIRVTNDGAESLNTILLTDTQAPACAGSVILPSTYPSTWTGFTTGGTGDKTDAILEPGEYFEYICEKDNTQGDYTNTAGVSAKGVNTGTDVDATDDSTVDVPGGGGSTYQCNDVIRQTADTVRCYGNSKVNKFYLSCDGVNSAVKTAGTDTNNRKYADFTCTSQNAQCYAYSNKNVTSIGSYAWRTSASCKLNTPVSCGNGIVEAGEQCDAGADNGKADSPCKASCEVKTTGGGSDPTCAATNSCVLTWPNGGEIVFGPSGTKIVGHGSNPLSNGESPYIYNNSDYDLSFEKLCIKRTYTDSSGGQSALVSPDADAQYCVNLGNDMIYAYERVELADYSMYPNYTGNKDGIPSAKDYGEAVLTTSLYDNGAYYYSAYFAADLDVRVAKPAIVTVGGGTSYVKTSTTADVEAVTSGVSGYSDNKNFVGTSASDSAVSSYAEEVTDTTAVSDIADEKTVYEETLDSVTDTTVTNGSTIGYSDFVNYNGLENIYILSGKDVTLSNIPSITEPTTYIIEGGDLTINGNLTTGENVAFVVKGGDIKIASHVTQIDGTYIAIPVTGNGGSIESDASGDQLVVHGSLYGDIDNLVDNRYYISKDGGQLSVGTIVSFGSGIFHKPAPLVSKFIGEYVDAEKIAR